MTPSALQPQTTQFRWLGLAGIQLRTGDNDSSRSLLIDPCFDRVPFWRHWIGRVRPDEQRIQRSLDGCDLLLVTHAHWDHLLDAPVISRLTEATSGGSPNTCSLLHTLGVPRDRLRSLSVGDSLAQDGFEVRVLSAAHVRVPGFGPGRLRSNLRPPLRARDYRMDADYCYLIATHDLRLLTDPGEQADTLPDGALPHADLLWLHPRRSTRYYERVISQVRPRVVVPYHWDTLWRHSPCSDRHSPRPMVAPQPGWPPLRRIDLKPFKQRLEARFPTVEVLIPTLWRFYTL